MDEKVVSMICLNHFDEVIHTINLIDETTTKDISSSLK